MFNKMVSSDRFKRKWYLGLNRDCRRSASSISFEIGSFYGLWTRIYEYAPPPSSITDLPQSLLNHSLSIIIIIIITGKNVRLLLNMLNALGFIKND